MDHTAFLLTLAQIAGVLVGFANLVSVFERSKIADEDLRVNKVRILIMTESGLLMIPFCFFPILISFFVVDEYLVFRSSSALVLFLFMVNLIFSLKRAKKYTGKIGPVQWLISLFGVLCVVVPLLMNLIGGVSPSNAVGIYCFSLFSIFLMLCFVFVRLLRSAIYKA